MIRAGLLLFLLLLWPAVAGAPPAPCYDRAVFAANLEAKFDETVRHVAVTAAGLLLEVYASPDGRTFTVAMGDGTLACPTLSGENWIDMDRKSKGDPM